MNPLQTVTYYLTHKPEFTGEDGHAKLLVGLKKHLPLIAGPLVGIDVGSCVGDYLPHMYALCNEPHAQILCFEPNPVNIQVLEPKVSSLPHVKLFKHCLSNETTTTSFYNWKFNKTNDPGNAIAGLRSGGSKICDVEVKCLQDVLDQECPNATIKFIKIDTEGNDSNVLKGFANYLPRTQCIIFECSDCLDDLRGPGIKNPMKDVVDFLSAHGFDTYRIGTKKLLKVNDDYWNQTYEDVKFWSNCFALPKKDELIHQLIHDNFDYTY